MQSLSFYFLLLSFFKSLLPREVRDRSVLLHEVDVSRRRERSLIQVEYADNTLSHMRIWHALARFAAEISYVLLRLSLFHFFPPIYATVSVIGGGRLGDVTTAKVRVVGEGRNLQESWEESQEKEDKKPDFDNSFSSPHTDIGGLQIYPFS